VLRGGEKGGLVEWGRKKGKGRGGEGEWGRNREGEEGGKRREWRMRGEIENWEEQRKGRGGERGRTGGEWRMGEWRTVGEIENGRTENGEGKGNKKKDDTHHSKQPPASPKHQSPTSPCQTFRVCTDYCFFVCCLSLSLSLPLSLYWDCTDNLNPGEKGLGRRNHPPEPEAILGL
jgi:hypothetical protein